MKQLAVLIILFGQFAFAGPGKFDSSAFNDIIQDNQKHEKSLQKKLQNTVGIELPDASQMGKISAENRVIESTVEQVAVKTSQVLNGTKTGSYQDDSESMNRVSQEVKDVFGN